jgi:hypothetical protein
MTTIRSPLTLLTDFASTEAVQEAAGNVTTTVSKPNTCFSSINNGGEVCNVSSCG